MWKNKNEERFRQVVCEPRGNVTRHHTRVLHAKIIGETSITTAVSTKYRRNPRSYTYSPFEVMSCKQQCFSWHFTLCKSYLLSQKNVNLICPPVQEMLVTKVASTATGRRLQGTRAHGRQEKTADVNKPFLSMS